MNYIRRNWLILSIVSFVFVLAFGSLYFFNDQSSSLDNQEITNVEMINRISDDSGTATNVLSATSVYAITYNGIDGATLDGEPTTYTYGVTTAIPNPTKTGYVFQGWLVNSSTEPVLNYSIVSGSTGPITLTAVWQYSKSYTYTISKETVGYSLTGDKAEESISYILEPITIDGTVVTENITMQNYINAIDRDRIVYGEDESISYENCSIEFSDFTDVTAISSGFELNNGVYSIIGELWFVNYAGITIGEDAVVGIGASLYDKQIDGTRVIISSSGDLTISGTAVIGTGINYTTSKIVINAGTLTINGMPTITSKIVIMSSDSYISLGEDFFPLNIAQNQGTSYAGKLNIFYNPSAFTAGITYNRIIRGYVDTSKVQAFVTSGAALTSRFVVNSTVTTDLNFEIAYKYVFYSDEGETGVSRSESVAYRGQVISIPTADSVTKTGFNLAGWFLNTIYPATQINGVTTTASGDSTVVRVNPLWISAQYFITYYNMSDAEHETGYPIRYVYTQSTTLKDATKSGYAFDGWYLIDGSTSGSWGEEVTVLAAETYTAGINLYAKWQAQVIDTAIEEDDVLVEGSISNPEGFEEGLTLVINKIDSSDFISSAPDNYEFSQIFNVQLLDSSEEGVSITNTVSLTVKLSDGIDLETLKVLVYENGEVVEKEFTILDGYITFELSTLSDFAFVTQNKNNLGWLSILFLAVIAGSTIGLYFVCHSTGKKPEVQILVPLKDVPAATFNTLAQRIGKLNYNVVYKNGVWVVKQDKSERQYVITDNRAVAIKYARMYCVREQAGLKIYGKDGKVQITDDSNVDLKNKK